MYRDWGDLQIEQRYSICFNLPQCKPCICTHLTVILIIMCGDWTKQILHTLNMSCTNWVYIFTISRPYKLHYTIYTEITSIIQHTDPIILLIFYNHNLTDPLNIIWLNVQYVQCLLVHTYFICTKAKGIILC